jgi:hypothetical protein
LKYGSSIQGRLQDGAKVEYFKYLSKGKIFLVPTLSITSLPEDEQKSKHGEEVGKMQFRVQGEQIKNDEKKKKEKMSIKKKREIKKNMYEKRKK